MYELTNSKRVAAACVVLAMLTVGCMGSRMSAKERRQSATIAMQAGTRNPALGLGFDLSYDENTDGIIPGYRIMQVGISNNSLNVVQLDPLTDRWYIVDRNGQQHAALINLRQDDPDVWSLLSPRLRRLIEYPLLVSVGATQPVDLLVPEKIDLHGFHQVVLESYNLDKIIHVYARETGE